MMWRPVRQFCWPSLGGPVDRMEVEMPFWYDVEGRRVVEHEEKGHDWQLMGPYPTREAAERALQTAAERSAAWDEQDKEWDES